MRQFDSRPLLRLETLQGVDGSAMRDRVVHALRRATGADFCAFTALAQVGDRVSYSTTACDGSPEMLPRYRRLDGSEVMPGGWDLRSPDDSYANHFERLSDSNVDRQTRLQMTVWQELYEPFEVGDQLRAILFDGVDCVGWLAAMVQGRTRRFSRKKLRAVTSHASRLRDALLAARVVDDPLSTDRAYALCTADGRISHLSRGASDLDGERMRIIEQCVRKADGLPLLRSGVIHQRVIRLDDGASARYLVLLERPSPPRTNPEDLLNSRQCEVARRYARGLSMQEVGSQLGITGHTVKYHLSNIYERLGVSSRTELAGVLP